MIISTDGLIVAIAIAAILLLIALGAVLMKMSVQLLIKGRPVRPAQAQKLTEAPIRETRHVEHHEGLADETASPALAAHHSAGRHV